MTDPNSNIDHPQMRTFLPMEFLHCRKAEFYIAGMGILQVLCSCDFDVDPITLIFKFETYSLEILYRECANMNFLRQGFRKISSDRQKDRHNQN